LAISSYKIPYICTVTGNTDSDRGTSFIRLTLTDQANSSLTEKICVEFVPSNDADTMTNLGIASNAANMHLAKEVQHVQTENSWMNSGTEHFGYRANHDGSARAHPFRWTSRSVAEKAECQDTEIKPVAKTA
jgi:hypothetical protein